LNGCIKEKFDPANLDTSLNFHSGLAVPVGFSHLGIDKYLSETPLQDELKIGKDGFLTFYHSFPIDSGIMGDILFVNDVSINNSLFNNTGSVIFLNLPGATADVVDSILIPLTTTQPNIRIDSIKLLSGNLLLDINSANVSGTITFELPRLVHNGLPFSITQNLSNPDLTLNLSNYALIPEQDVSGNNLIKCRISIHLQSPAGPVNAGGVILDIHSRLTSLNYETIFGYFGGYTIDFAAQSVSTSFFRQINGEIFFADPKLKLFFSNSAGIPFGIYFSRFDAIDKNNISHPLTGTGVPTASSPKIIRYPSLSQIGTTVTDSLIFDKNNSNLPDFIALLPDSIGINASAEVVALTPPATTFISHDSKYNVSAAIELPLFGKADFLLLTDTMDFDYLNSALPPPEEIEKLIVRTSITNSFPVTAYPQIYLLDNNRMLLDSLFTGTEKIEGASDTNGDGISDPHHQPPIDIDLPRSRIDNLMNTRYLLVKGKIMTTDFPNKDVKIYSAYFLDYNVGVIAKLKVIYGK
jgi:hypothetical protein